MKKITFIVFFITLFFGVNYVQAQVSEPANWPNSDWQVRGYSYDASGLKVPTDNVLKDENPLTPPLTAGTSFGYDNTDPAGTGSYIFDHIYLESPVYDLRPATTATPAHGQVVVSFDYVYYQVGSSLKLQWSINPNSPDDWVDWQDITGNSSSSTDYLNCDGLISFQSIPLMITTLSQADLQNFRYRINYDDNNASFQFGGFCVGSPTLTSQETALCIAVSGINADESPILDDQATISWSDNNGISPQDGWEIEYGTTGFTQGAGISEISLNSSYTLMNLNASTCYDVYVRALCDSANNVYSDWVGPFNFCTPIATAGCGDVFYDIGGPNANYNDSMNETTTFCPDNSGDVVSVIFDAFNTEQGYDDLTIYDGPDASSPSLGTFEGTALPNGGDIISASLANGGCLTFVFHSDGSVNRDGWEARILCSPPITCFMPENLTVDNASITIHEATISWSDTNNTIPQSGWEIEYGPFGFTQGSGTIVTASTETTTLINLDPATEYCYYVKAVCGANSGDEDSFWEGPVCFTTKCDVFQAPYSENFENNGDIPVCWNQGANNAEYWLFDNDVTAPGHIGNGGNVNGTTTLSGGYFAYVDDDSPNSLNTELVSPFVDLTGIANPTLGFYYISHHEFLFASVTFSIDIWDGTTWNEVLTHSGNTNGWEQIFVDLSAYNNQVIQVKFIVDENTTSIFDDFAIDDVYIGEMPSCVNVNGLSIDSVGATDVTLSWTDGNIPTATAWEVVYGAPGFDPDTATVNAATSSVGYIQAGLTDQTDYEIYVRTDCGGGDYSLWAGPIAFTTLCPIFDAPYHEDFSDGGVLDACWDQSANLDPWEFSNNVGAPGHVGDNGDVMGTTTESGGYFAYVDDSSDHTLNNTITTPLINTSTLANPALYFYYVSDNEGSSNVDFSIDVWDGAVWNDNFFTSNSNTEGWEQVAIDLTTLAITGPIQIRFTVDENNGSDFSDDLAIDDIKVDEAPDCWPIFDPIVSNETESTVEIAWTDDDNATPPNTTYTIHYGPVGFTLGTTGTNIGSQDVSPFSNPFTVTGLAVDFDWDFYVVAHCPNGDSYVGPVQGTTLPTCLQVTGINTVSSTLGSVTVSWTDNNTPVPDGNWDVEVTYPSFGQGTGDVYSNVTSPFEILNLIPSSTFEIYIRANCEIDGSDPSRWTGPFTINTVVGVPFNDLCINATELNVTADCEPKLGNNIMASETSPDLATNCSDPAIDGTTSGFEVDDVWYKFTMPTSGSALIQTGFAGVMEDSAIAVYHVDDVNNACGTLVPALSYFPNGNINYALNPCSDDDDFINNDSSDDNMFSMVQLVNQTPGDIYYVRVWSVDRSNLINNDGQNLHGQFTICVTDENVFSRNALATEDSDFTNKIILNYYPNPTSSVLNLKADTVINEVRIYSVLGQEVSHQEYNTPSNTIQVKMHNLKSGTYFVKVFLANITKTITIIKK